MTPESAIIYHSRLNELQQQGLSTRRASAKIPTLLIEELRKTDSGQIVILFAEGEGNLALSLGRKLGQQKGRDISAVVGVGGEKPRIILTRKTP